MKSTILLILINLTYSVTAQRWIDLDETIQVNDTIYSKETGLPYSGLITQQSDEGIITWQARTVDGLYEGYYISLYPNGDTLQKGDYKKGKLDGFIYYYESEMSFGQKTKPHLWLKIYFKNGKRNGISESYYDNGQAFITSQYTNNENTGNCKIFLKSGALYAEGELFSGECVGIWKIFYIDKTVSATLTFRENQLESCVGDCKFISSYDDIISAAIQSQEK